jgi:hypothetical protein
MIGMDLTGAGRDADGPIAREQHPVDQRVGTDRQVLAPASAIEVGEAAFQRTAPRR